MKVARASTVVLLALSVAACQEFESCNGRAHVAELTGSVGLSERSSGNLAQWRPAGLGDTFDMGDALRTQHQSNARIRLTAGGGLSLGPDSMVRFVAGPVGATRGSVRVEEGEAELEAGNDDVVLETNMGSAHLEHGGRLHVTSASGESRLQVVLGRVVLDRATGGELTAAEGDRLVVRVAGAILEREDAGAPHAPTRIASAPVPIVPDAGADAGADAAVAAGPPVVVPVQIGVVVHRRPLQVLASDGSWRRLGVGGRSVPSGSRLRVVLNGTIDLSRGQEHAHVRGPIEVVVGAPGEPLYRTQTSDNASAANAGADASGGEASADVRPEISVPAGESSLIHHAAGNTAVRVTFSDACSETMSMTVGHRTISGAPGAQAIVLVLPAGGHHYELRCSANRAYRRAGALRIVADAGSTPLPRRAAHDTLDADGRRYSLLYQNLLPEITMRWPHPPSGGPFTLSVSDHAGHTQTFSSHEPSVTIASGRLTEGSYDVRFEGGGEHSASTAVQVRFDNAARTSSVTEPADGSISGGTAHVLGSAVAGSVVTAAGVHLPLDGQNRFRGDVPVASDQPTLVIRIAHPSHGVQYYLRSTGSAPP